MDAATSSTRVSQVLQALADLSPSAEPSSTRLTVPTEWFQWLDVSGVNLFSVSVRPGLVRIEIEPNTEDIRSAVVDRKMGERLAAVDQLRPGQRSIRVGWLWLAGRVPDGQGRMRRVFHPLLTTPVRVFRPPAVGPARLLPGGDIELSELIRDVDDLHRLESAIRTGGGALASVRSPEIPKALLSRLTTLRSYAQDLASAAGYETTTIVPASLGPDQLMRSDGISVIAGLGVYAVHETNTTSRAGSLRTWASTPIRQWTAFHSLYASAGDAAEVSVEPVRSPFVLTDSQQAAVVESRTAPITLVSGAPGTGKSHTIVAIANDALARGESVLVSARADATVDALLDLFERSPGPQPIVFGSNERREELAARLAGGRHAPVSAAAVEKAQRAHVTAWTARDRLEQSIVARLGAESLISGKAADHGASLIVAPGLFEAGVDLDAAAQSLSLVLGTGGGGGRGGGEHGVSEPGASRSRPTNTRRSRRSARRSRWLDPCRQRPSSRLTAGWRSVTSGRVSPSSIRRPARRRRSGYRPRADQRSV